MVQANEHPGCMTRTIIQILCLSASLAPSRIGCLARRGLHSARREPMPLREDKNFLYTFQAMPERLSVYDSACISGQDQARESTRARVNQAEHLVTHLCLLQRDIRIRGY